MKWSLIMNINPHLSHANATEIIFFLRGFIVNLRSLAYFFYRVELPVRGRTAIFGRESFNKIMNCQTFSSLKFCVKADRIGSWYALPFLFFWVKSGLSFWISHTQPAGSQILKNFLLSQKLSFKTIFCLPLSTQPMIRFFEEHALGRESKKGRLSEKMWGPIACEICVRFYLSMWSETRQDLGAYLLMLVFWIIARRWLLHTEVASF